MSTLWEYSSQAILLASHTNMSGLDESVECHPEMRNYLGE